MVFTLVLVSMAIASSGRGSSGSILNRGRETPFTEATIVKIEQLEVAFQQRVPTFPKQGWDDVEGLHMLLTPAQHARALADGLEFAWSMHNETPEHVAAMLQLATWYSIDMSVEDAIAEKDNWERAIVLFRMMYDESAIYPVVSDAGTFGDRLTFFGAWAPAYGVLAGGRTLEPILVFGLDAPYWTHKLHVVGIDSSEHANESMYEGPPYSAVHEYLDLVDRALPRYDLPLRAARLRECASWLDRHESASGTKSE